MSKAAVQDYLCRSFCSFYRPGDKAELACQGALVLAELLQGGQLNPDDLPGPEAKGRRLWQQEDRALERIVCLPCPFAGDDCDFHSILRSAETEPCGGYLLLQLLRERGTISCAELNRASGAVAHVA